LSEAGVKALTKELKVLVFDRDLKGRTFGSFPVTEDGSKIRIKSGGKGHFMPTFDNDSFIEFPRKFLRWNRGWERVYFVRNGAKACVRFRPTPNALNIESIADLQEVIEAAENGNPEAQYQLAEVMGVLQTAGDDDYLKPDPKLVEEFARNQILRGIGADERKETPWWVYIMLFVLIGVALKVFGVIA